MSSANTASEEIHSSSDNGPATKKLKTSDNSNSKVEDTGSLKNNGKGMNVGVDSTADNNDNNAGVDGVSGDGESTKEKVIKDLQKCQQKISSLTIKEAFSPALEEEFNEHRRPFIQERDELIKKIPDFWVQSFINHPVLTTIMEGEDEQCLHYLRRLEVEEFISPKSGFRIKFHFDDNPYFENAELVKEFHHGSSGSEPASTSTPINWKNTEWAERLRDQTVNRTKNEKSRKRKNSGPAQTFFSWYLHYGDPAVDPIAKILKEEMYFDPVQYYLIHDNEEEESLDDEDDDEEEYEEEDEEDEESGDDKSIDLESEEDEEADEDDDEEENEGEGEGEGEEEEEEDDDDDGAEAPADEEAADGEEEAVEPEGDDEDNEDDAE